MSRLRSEDDFLALVDRYFPNDRIELGRGDDAAVFTPGGPLALSTDLFLEHTHFRTRYFDPAAIGHKALAVNISDMAGMGARPTGFALSVSAVGEARMAELEDSFWDDCLAAMARLAERFAIPLVGGDVSRSDALSFCVAIWGERGPGERFLTRKTGAVGETLFLVQRPGTAELHGLGLARTGLMALEEQGRSARESYPVATGAHLTPEPLVDAGLALAACENVTSLMDVSDGLARDLPRLLPRGAGARLSLSPDALHPELVAFCAGQGSDPLRQAVLGGEDYLLLGTCRGDLPAVPGIVAIGEVTATPGLTVNGEPFREPGFDHFG